MASKPARIPATVWKSGAATANCWEKHRWEIAKTFAMRLRPHAKPRLGPGAAPTTVRKFFITWPRILRFAKPTPKRVIGLAWRPSSPRKSDFMALGRTVIEALGMRTVRKDRQEP